MKQIGQTTVYFLILTLNTIISGFVLQKLYIWFIIPVFHTVNISLVEVIGISLLISYIRFKKPERKTEYKEFWLEIIEGFLHSIFLTIYVLLVGWVITLFL